MDTGRTAFALAVLAAVATGCGTPELPCPTITIENPPSEGQVDVSPGLELSWDTNPPASGAQYWEWAHWNRTYLDPVPRGYWLHNVEHGGTAFLFNCPDGCAEDVAALEDLVNSLPQDPLCVSILPTRTLITADPLLPPEDKFVAVGFTWIYRANCFDADSLREFYMDHAGESPLVPDPAHVCEDGTYPPF